jgi:hypothetical protein
MFINFKKTIIERLKEQKYDCFSNPFKSFAPTFVSYTFKTIEKFDKWLKICP